MSTSFNTARQRIGGIKGVMRALGDAPPHDHKWKSMPQCPFCGQKDCAGVFTKAGVDFFKCHKSSCSSGGTVMAEVQYIACREGLSDSKPADGGASPAYKRFLQLANCWEEPTSAKPQAVPPPKKSKVKPPETPSLLNPPAAVKSPPPVRFPVVQTPPPATGAVPPPPVPVPVAPVPGPATKISEDEKAKLLRHGVEVIRSMNLASREFLMEFLKVDEARADWVLDELRRSGALAADLTIVELPPRPPGIMVFKDVSDGGVVKLSIEELPEFEEGVIAQAISIVQSAQKASVAQLKREMKVGHARATRIMEELERRGIVGASKNGTDRDLLVPGAAPTAAPAEPGELPKVQKEKRLARGLAPLREFYGLLAPGIVDGEFVQMVPYLPPAEKLSPEAKADWEAGFMCREVARKLKFRPVSFYAKRGLSDITCMALGFRANPMTNEAILQQLQEKYPWEELFESGLWLEADKRRKLGRRPNAQFCGKGQVGKKPERERRGKDDKWVWGMCEPVLIPYFDEMGEMMKLRPHKGGAPKDTTAGREMIYVPRAFKSCADEVEKFTEVVICEGEFKAAALWQMLGAGFKYQGVSLPGWSHEPIGVCAVPGISYAKNLELRLDLERWLQDVGCRRVIVAFDDEDKSSKPLRQRHDAQIMARYLATDLGQKLHLDARIGVLPTEWRQRGKADWDGALAMLLKSLEPKK